MGLALAAELNGYPGPAHVLEMGDQLGLSGDQRDHMRRLFAAMQAEAIPLGERLISEEVIWMGCSRHENVTPEALADATKAIGRTQRSLREAHLKYHLATVAVLMPDQVARYNALRLHAARAASSIALGRSSLFSC